MSHFGFETMTIIRFFMCLSSILLLVPMQLLADSDFIARAEFYIQEVNPNFTTQLEFTAVDKIPSDCPFPIFDLPNKRKTWGKNSLKVTCDSRKIILPVNIIAFADVAIATEDIQRGDSLTPQNITIQNHDITSLTVAPVTDIQLLYDAQSLRNIAKETIITFPMLKRAWLIKAGDTVKIQMSGDGFSAHNTGKAINNAYKGDKVRIRLENKTIIEGTALATGQVVL